MAMNGKTLGSEIAKAITDSSASEDATAAVEAVWEKIGEKIVTHIMSNAEITVAVGIKVETAGSPTAQTGATTSTGTAKIK